MQRQAASVVYLTLENASGATSVLGVTAEHPLHSDGNWLEAGALAPGDVISDSALLPLTVLAVRGDDIPQLVHNLEIGGAHTYFAGEMAAWAHNGWKGRAAFYRRLLGCNTTLDLSRFDAASLIAFTATKETDYGTETDGRIPPRCGAYCTDQWTYTQASGG